MKLLHLDSSILGQGSTSRELTRAIVDGYRAGDPGLEVVYHDLGARPFPHLSPDGGDEEAQLKERLIEELKSADVLVIGAPLYNFTIPSGLKSWVDRIAVAGKTFRYGANGPEGLVGDKKAYVVATAGGVYSDSPVRHMHAGYLQTVLNFVGISDVEIIAVEGLGMPEVRPKALAASRERIASIFGGGERAAA